MIKHTYIIPVIELVTQSLHIRFDFRKQRFLLGLAKKIFDDQHVSQELLAIDRWPFLLEINVGRGSNRRLLSRRWGGVTCRGIFYKICNY